ncbi:MAG: hypothetical protein CFH18_00768 [Alphaproteobacteria bacterium MarineAlpha5_Bin8]|nr:MAG: hypothetical protein CFH17_01001 [Alphaproteobacteria bacterium MarineAlpha5_Bin7]PPR45814.1 MAG: hypothetical protein CFH18_00768 [Alphaproteobacteria bacterium MarineAlpha5_Bin8]PPR54496.1 MAG: hypothetical protein CFH16_00368 [Alphaproteobacteria bacterium MarineAlpha5_Bin6]|tara:strand:+ start:2750 stop:3373 length:624 start_codon:yes stop_codon:yes gene_type:complete
MNTLIKFFTIFILFFSSNLFAENNYINISYGITAHDLPVTATRGTITKDDDDEGFIVSAGALLGDSWGIDVMYYDLGSSSFKVDALDIIKIDNVDYEAQSGGTITNDISGYGIGLIGISNTDVISFYIKAGIHSWDKSGSTTILDNDNAFAGSFYNEGIGGYGGLGIGFNVLENITLNISYDIIGLSNNAQFDNSSSIFAGGLIAKF